MRKFSVSDKIQIIGAAAIVLSLLLVLFEMQQSRQITGAQLMAQQFDGIADRYLALMGEDSAATLAKACHQPDTLTPAEQIVLDAYLNANFLTIRRMRELAEFGNFVGGPSVWRAWSQGNFRYIFAYPQSAAWWDEIRRIYAPVFPDIVEIGDGVFAAVGDEHFCKTYYQSWSPGS